MLRTMWKLLFAFVAAITLHSCFVALSTPARADALAFSCSGSRHALNCSLTPLPSADAKVLRVPPDVTPEGIARARRWVRLCDPQIAVDDLGVEHFVYARPGCDVGAPR